MLTYFPTPYPGEWWYSVLCRYFVRSGNPLEANARKDLYGGRLVNHGQGFPLDSCLTIQTKMPQKCFKLGNILLNHTLLPYRMRMVPQEKKDYILRQLLDSDGIKLRKSALIKIEGPKFCPICFRQDRAHYGEAYWHREHQITLMTLCPRHRCRLEQPDVEWRRRMKGFLPLDLISCPQASKEHERWEAKLAEVLCSYVTLPYLAGPDKRYNNLIWALMAQGYVVSTPYRGNELDTIKLYQDCKRFFNPEIMDKYFPLRRNMIFYQMKSFSHQFPERYALLEAFSGLTPEEFFGPDLSSGKRTANRFKLK